MFEKVLAVFIRIWIGFSFGCIRLSSIGLGVLAWHDYKC